MYDPDDKITFSFTVTQTNQLMALLDALDIATAGMRAIGSVQRGARPLLDVMADQIKQQEQPEEWPRPRAVPAE